METIKSTVLILALALSGFAADAANTGQMRVGPSTTISFEPGRATLTADSKARLKTLIKDARSMGRIGEIQVAAWSDNPIPADKKTLSKADQNLAGSRAKALRDYLNSSLSVPGVVLYNMAERSTWLSRMFETDDAELKEEIVRGENTPMSKEEFRVFRDNGKPSAAIVLAIVRD